MIAGFECSCHRTAGERRVDMIEASFHERLARDDYLRLRCQRFRTAREGVRWHLVERRAGRYDFSSAVPIVRAARATGTQLIWDLCHFGWPDHLDVFSSAFIKRFSAMAAAFLRFISSETDQQPIVAPVNEISFLAWACGEAGSFHPYQVGRSEELKRQLVRAAIEAVEAVWGVAPGARIVHTDPAINVVAGSENPADIREAKVAREAQFDAWDMLSGRRAPHLGGHPKYLDVIGVNYYPHNQWIHRGGRLAASDLRYVPLRRMIRRNFGRYGRPILLAETSIEGPDRATWLRYVGREVRAAMLRGVRMEGLCWYPVVNHPGWDDGRRCENGLWDYPDRSGDRPIHMPLARELRRQRRRLRRLLGQCGSRVTAQLTGASDSTTVDAPGI